MIDFNITYYFTSDYLGEVTAFHPDYKTGGVTRGAIATIKVLSKDDKYHAIRHVFLRFADGNLDSGMMYETDILDLIKKYNAKKI